MVNFVSDTKKPRLQQPRNGEAETMDCEIYDMPLFRGSDRSIVDPILRRSNSRMGHYRKGETIALQNDVCRTLMLLCEGSVYARMTSHEGREFILDPLTAPDIVASPFIFATENIYPVTIIAQNDSRLWFIDRTYIRELLEQDNTVLHNFLRDLSDHSLYLSRKLNEFALQTLSSRVMGYLQENHSIHNLQQTAFVLGVTRPSLSRALAQLLAQGRVRKTDAGYILG